MTNQELINKYVPIKKQKKAYKDLKKGKPIQYIIGTVDFYGYELKVNKNVLIPRFETETLVEKTIQYIKKYYNTEVKIADLGTGSGAIGIALEKELKADVTMFDISNKAIKVAKENIKLHKCEGNVLKSDIKKTLPGIYDVLISNPPYIATNEEVECIVAQNEPRLALYADDDGLEFYKKILDYSKEILHKKNIIAFEIGYTQGSVLKEYASKIYKDAIITIEQDLCGKDRYLFIINE